MVKTYAPRGPLQQYRVTAATAFACFRCGRTKKSKLITVHREDWTRLLCNACYGRLLSIYQVIAGTGDGDAKAQALSEQLLVLVSSDDLRRATGAVTTRLLGADMLQPKSLRMLATAEFVARGMRNAVDLDWSSAVIALCKAVEVELGSRVAQPLRVACEGVDLTPDLADKDLGRVARYCAGKADAPPELGVLDHFLRTAAHSRSRQQSSPLLAALRDVARDWPHADWLVEPCLSG